MKFSDIEEAFVTLARTMGRDYKLANETEVKSSIGALVLHGDWVGVITNNRGAECRLISGTFRTNRDFWQAIVFYTDGVVEGTVMARRKESKSNAREQRKTHD
jgi:hypothetical protein